MIPIASPTIGEKELQYVSDAVLSGWISSKGKYIDRFEERFAAFCSAPRACAVSNGTTALHLALLAAGVGEGDEVILPSLTFISPANAISYCGAKAVFVDVEADSWNIDPGAVEVAITPKTKAIVAVHLYGNPCRMADLQRIADGHGLTVIEDAAEAHGACIDGRPVGSWGDYACFSFFGNKILTTGEGGAIIAKDAKKDAYIRMLRDHGMDPKRRYWHEEVGYNYRMTNLQAAIGVAQIERSSEILDAKERIKRRYDKALANVSIRCPIEDSNAASVCWLYTFVVEAFENAIERDLLIDRLKEKGIDSRPVFNVIPAMPPFYEADWEDRYPIARRLSETGISLPSLIESTDDQIDSIAQAVTSLISTNPKS
ncbi:MAG: hypothetical protein CBD18_05290 [Opitutales bacterium TMED158]|nr:MAG: hypothetical protein CBD18_05290 [Opitutales bacterium TMED158]